MTATDHLPPTILADVFTKPECEEMIAFAETQRWNIEGDSVDDQPAWELEVLSTELGKMASARLHQRMVGIRSDIRVRKFAIYIRKYGADARPNLAPHEDRSLVSFTAALNDDFEGGTFFSTTGDAVESDIPLSTGDAIMFGGNVLHGIRTVEAGIRYSIVMHCI